MGRPRGVSKTEVEAAQRLHYTAVKALGLKSSSNSRPGLPIEVILHICHLADFVNPWPDNSVYTEVEYDRELVGTPMALLFEGSPVSEVRPWLCTPPLHSNLLRKAWRVEPRIHPAEPVMSRTHAFRPDELIIRIKKGSPHQYRADIEGKELSWRYLTARKGEASLLRTFDRQHEIWKWLEPGDCIEVAVDAAGWYFPNIRSEWGASLRVHTLWEPSEEMLSLIYTGAS